MKKSIQFSRIAAVAVALWMTATMVTAGEYKKPPDPGRVQAAKEVVDPANLPPQVRQALQEAAPNENWDSIEKVSQDGQVGYKVVTNGAQGKHVILVSENGKIWKKDILPAETFTGPSRVQAAKDQINPADLPPQVRQALNNAAPNENWESAEKVSRDDQVGYKVVTNGAQGKHLILVSESGKILKKDILPAESSTDPSRVQAAKDHINPADLPPQVRQAINNAAPGESFESVQKVTRDGQVGYMAVMAGARGKHVILVSENGKVLKDEIKPEGESFDHKMDKKIERIEDKTGTKIEKTKEKAQDKTDKAKDKRDNK